MIDRGAMTNAADDPGMTESSNAVRHASSSNDRDWEDFIKSCPQNGADFNLNHRLSILGLENTMATQFGDIDDVLQAHSAPTTTINNTSSDYTTNGLPQAYQTWPLVPSAPPTMTGYDQHQAAPSSWMSDQVYQQHHQSPHQYDQPMQSTNDQMSLFLPHQAEEYYEQRPYQYQDSSFDRQGPTSHPVYTADPMQLSVDDVFPQDSIDGGSAYPSGDFNNYLNSNPNLHQQQQFYDNDSESLDTGEEGTDPCYAQLLHRCLKEAPDHTLSLKEVYEWVLQHSQKAKNKDRGWQNSVRHNLSMNAVSISIFPYSNTY
jgi:hypothetical protein